MVRRNRNNPKWGFAFRTGPQVPYDEYQQCLGLVFIKTAKGSLLQLRCQRTFKHRKEKHQHRIQWGSKDHECVMVRWEKSMNGTVFDPRTPAQQKAWAEHTPEIGMRDGLTREEIAAEIERKKREGRKR